jgi:hypothetical protein
MGVGFCVSSTMPPKQLRLATLETGHLGDRIIFVGASMDPLHAAMLKFTLIVNLVDVMNPIKV